MDKTRRSLTGIKNLLYPHGSKNSPMVVGNHGYPSVEKVAVVGNYAAKVEVL